MADSPTASSAVDAGVLALFADGLPVLSTKLNREQVLQRLDASARRGKLAGFQKGEGANLFEVEAYSAPFDHVLLATAQVEGNGTRLEFRTRMLRKLPLIYAIGTAVTIWPGLPLTHSMLQTYFSWYHWGYGVTAAWYLAVSVLPMVWWTPRAIRKSRASAAEAAREQVLKLRDLLDGTLTQG